MAVVKLGQGHVAAFAFSFIPPMITWQAAEPRHDTLLIDIKNNAQRFV